MTSILSTYFVCVAIILAVTAVVYALLRKRANRLFLGTIVGVLAALGIAAVTLMAYGIARAQLDWVDLFSPTVETKHNEWVALCEGELKTATPGGDAWQVLERLGVDRLVNVGATTSGGLGERIYYRAHYLANPRVVHVTIVDQNVRNRAFSGDIDMTTNVSIGDDVVRTCSVAITRTGR